MAVEIPVFIDVEKAFKEAASRLPQAIQPLQKYMDANALYIRVNIDGKKTYIKDILDDSTMSARQLNQALEQVNAWINARAKSGGFDLLGGLTQSEKIHLQVLGALEHRINGVSDASSMMARIYTANIERTKARIEALSASIDALTRKQNQYYKTVNGKRVPGGQAYERTKAQIADANAELAVTKKSLASLTIELSKITAGGAAAASSVKAIRTSAMEMADAWRRGSTYIERWNQGLGVANSRLGMLIKGSISLMALHAATSFVRNIRQVTAEFEMQRVALGGIIQDTERAEQLFRQIKAAAIKSPFEIKDLVSFTKQLSAYRIETDQLFDVTMKLADVSAGLGVDMKRLVLAYGQVRAAAVLRGQELRQFTEAGIPLVELLAKKFQELGREGTTTADVFELISKRAVPFSMIEEIFNDMTKAGGMFYKMQEKQSETLKGQWMKLKDALSIMYDEIGNTSVVHGAMEALLRDAMSLMQNWREVGRSVGVVVSSIIAYKVAIINARIAQNALTAAEMAEVSLTELNVVGKSRLIAALAGETAATKIQVALSKAYVWAKSREMMATNMFTKSLYKMIAAMLSNPYALAIAGIVGLIAVFIRLSKKAEEARMSVDGFKKSLESFTTSNSHARDVDELCDKYETLAKKVDRTEEETQQLIRTSKELGKLYPQMVKGVDAHTGALSLNTEAIRANNAETREAIRLALEQDKKEAQNSLDDLLEERDEILKQLESGKKVTAIRVGSGTNLVETTLSDKDKADLGKRLLELQPQIEEFTKEIGAADVAVQDFQEDLVGPSTPEFFDNAWKLQLSRYETTLRSSNDTVKALSNDQIKSFDNQKVALEAVAKEYEGQIALVDFYTKALITATGARKAQTEAARKDAEDMAALYESILKDYNALDLIRSSGGGGGSAKTDPFITLMQNRIKFMQDFKKGYDDLSKYMSSAQAEIEESTIMLGRGQSLGLNADQQLRATNGLSKWYEDMIEDVKKKLREKGVSGVSATDFLSIDTTKKSKAVQDLQKLLQQLWDAKTDYDTSERKKQIEDALKKLSEEIKRSETAKNFFENVLGLTGDKELAGNLAVSVYGDPGEEIGTRIKDSIEGALDGMKLDKTSGIGKTLLDAAGNMDFREVMKNIDQVPQDLRETVKNAAATIEKYNADTANSYVKLLMQFDEIGQKRRTIEDKADKDIATLREGLALELKAINEKMEGAEKEAAEKAAKAREEAAEEGVNRQRELDLLRTSRDYRLFFETIGTISLASARKIAKAERDIVSAQFEAHEINLNQYLRALNRIDEQLKKYEDERNPIVTYLTKGLDGLFEKLKQTDINLRAFAGNLKDDEGNFSLPEGLKEAVNTIGKIFGGSIFGENIKGRKNVFDQLKEELKENADAWEETLDRVAEKLGEMGSDMSRGFGWAGFWVSFAGGAVKSFDQIAQKSKNTEGEVKEGWNAVGKFIMTSAAGMLVGNPLGAGVLGQLWDVDDAWERFTSLNEKAMSGFEKFKSGDIIGAIADNIEGWSEVFGKNTKAIDRQIKEQSDNIEELKYQYDRLGVAIEDAFGSDYIYNFQKQVEVLQAQAEAYRKQAELEQQKGDKKRDDEKIKGYKNSAREIEDQIKDMQGQLAEFFTGTDLTSAARDFAQAWIEAYKEFGSTTDAMKEKFDEMIENMVVNSLAAKFIQSILDPLFKQIDAAAKDGDLTAQEIGEISEQLPGLMGQIDNALGTMVSQLSAAGINLRQQAGQFTGISRDIAGASEESILGLAAGVNTANFYMSHLPAIAENVAALRAYIVGDAAATVRTTASEGPTYEDQMLGYAANLPMMRDDMYAIRSLLEKVIKPVGTAYYVSVR